MQPPSCFQRVGLVAGAVAMALAAVALPAQANDPAAGRQKAQSCAVCHGPMGVSSAPDAPHLAGQPAIYLQRQLKAYRSGERKHEIMNVIAKPLTDAEIMDLAAWFASVRVEAREP